MCRVLYRLLAGLAGLAVRSGRSKDLEIIVLRHQVAVLRRSVDRPAVTDDDRSLLAAIAHALPRPTRQGWLVTPDTLLRWHRQLIAKKYDGSRGKVGRPTVGPEIATLAVRMAKENPSWGYTRIQGALSNLGHRSGRNTIARILEDHGIVPAPRRGMSWKTFLRAHWEAIAASDMFTVEVWVGRSLVRYHVLFAIGLATRRVNILGIAPEPEGRWMEQVARNATDGFSGVLLGKKYLIIDRDPRFTREFRSILSVSGVKVIRTPPRSPNLKGYAS
jgi:hypothetical protein